VTSELSVSLDPALADIVRARSSSPHRFDPPASWFALDYLAAVRQGRRLWFSDGHALWSAAAGVWRFADHPDVARIIAAHPYPPGAAPPALPRALPLGAVGPDAMLWGLRWYDTDSTFVWTPVVLDAASREVRVLRSEDGHRIGGTAPQRLLATGAPDRLVIAGQEDAGAAVHWDEYVMVDVAWEVDLTRGVYRAGSAGRGEPSRGIVAVTASQTLSHEGLSYGHGHGDSDRAWVFAVRDGDELLTLDLSAHYRATVRVAPR
jgi:hypothetical protein